MAIGAGAKLGPYEIRSPLGSGGMGEVYRAYDPRLEREVALKILPSEFSANPDRLRRFEQEARSASALNHPNIIAIYDIGTDDGLPYICMELIDGKSLRAVLAEGPLPIRKTVSLATQLADGLAKAHSAGIVHRDLKPENLMISKDGFLKILDFGLAKLTADSDEGASNIATKTGEGIVLGTVGYMSPEQASGNRVDFRSDQFSFGIILYEMITGKPAFKRPTPAETMTAIIREEPEAVTSLNPQTPTSLRWIVERCLAKDPEERYASTRDLARDLQILRNHFSELTTSSHERVPASQRPRGRTIYLTLLLIGLAFAAGILLNPRRSSSNTVEPVRFLTLTYSGKDSSPAASPDGKLIAFRSDRDGKGRIWLKQLAGGNEVALTSGSDDYPRFSPDSSAVLFVRKDGAQSSLYRVSVVGGEERKILENVDSADWSPDGKQVATARLSSGNTILATANIDGTSFHELITIQNRRLEFPRWSPDGKQILATRSLEGNVLNADNIVIVDVATKRADWIRTTWPTSSAWTGSKQKIVYAISESPAAYPVDFRSSSGLILQDVVSKKFQRLLWMPPSGDVLDILDQGRLVLHSAAIRQNLRQLSLSDASSDQWFTRGQSIDRQPVYSRDGTRILFSSSRSGNLDLWEMTIATGALKRITEDASEDWDPAYTADGKQIIWSCSRNGHFEIWSANADGSAAHQVTHDGYDAENPTMTPDGSWIVYNSYNSHGPGIWKIHPDGKGAQWLVHGVTAWPEVSPDGRHIAYVWYQDSFLRDPYAFIKVMDLASGQEVPFRIQCMNGNNLGGRVRWMPNSQTLVYFDQNEKGEWAIFLQEFIRGKETRGASRRQLEGLDPDRQAETFGISPDGAKIIRAEIETLSSIVLVENVPGISRAHVP